MTSIRPWYRRPSRVIPAALAAQEVLLQRSQVRLIGACEGVQEHYYAISTERKVMHPLVQQMLKRP